LRGERRAASRAAVRELLLLDPAYEGDSIFDPPDYVAFIGEVRDRELSLPIVDVPVPNITAVDPGLGKGVRPGFPLWVTLHVGASAYGGERGRPTDSPISDFTANAGISLGAAVATPIGRMTEVGLRVQAHYLPSRFFYAVAVPGIISTTLDRDASSEWTMVALANAAISYPAHQRFIPALTLGIGGAFSYLNDQTRVGLIVQPGLRAEIPIDHQWSALVSADVGVVMPGDALDLRTVSPTMREGAQNFDLMTHLGAGLRYRLSL